MSMEQDSNCDKNRAASPPGWDAALPTYFLLPANPVHFANNCRLSIVIRRLTEPS
jgi:hypothetical protein